MLTSLVSTLPASWQPYAKTYISALLSLLTVLSVALPAAPDWLPIAIAILSAPLVFATPNLDPRAAKQDESVQPPVTLLTRDDAAGPLSRVSRDAREVGQRHRDSH